MGIVNCGNRIKYMPAVGDKIYAGSWWIEKDVLGRDFVRAHWPLYVSMEPKSLFSPKNPRYGSATSIRYYINTEYQSIIVAGQEFRAAVILVPGCAFP